MLMRRPTLLVADDHAIFLEGVVRVLEEKFTLLATVADGLALRSSEDMPRSILGLAAVIAACASAPMRSGPKPPSPRSGRGG